MRRCGGSRLWPGRADLEALRPHLPPREALNVGEGPPGGAGSPPAGPGLGNLKLKKLKGPSEKPRFSTMNKTRHGSEYARVRAAGGGSVLGGSHPRTADDCASLSEGPGDHTSHPGGTRGSHLTPWRDPGITPHTHRGTRGPHLTPWRDPGTTLLTPSKGQGTTSHTPEGPRGPHHTPETQEATPLIPSKGQVSTSPTPWRDLETQGTTSPIPWRTQGLRKPRHHSF